jgi:hypothetical protein
VPSPAKKCDAAYPGILEDDRRTISILENTAGVLRERHVHGARMEASKSLGDLGTADNKIAV